MITEPRAILGGVALACVIATLLVFYYASVQKVRTHTAAKNERVYSRSLSHATTAKRDAP